VKDIKKEIADALSEIIKEEIGGEIEVEIFTPQNFSYGDYSTNISLVIFHKLREKFKNPFDLADFIVNQLQKKLPNIEKIQAFPPGFINFWVSQNYLLRELDQIITLADNFGKGTQLRNKKIMLEFADPNPFKEFHIGHLRNISLGESYARLLEFQEAEVWRVNYQGDVGMHVAKALYGIQNSEFRIQNFEDKPLKEKVKFLGEAYARGARAYEEDKKARKKIEDINLKIYRKSDPSLNKLWEEGRQWSLEHFEEIYKRVGTKYKRYYFESETAELGREIVLANIKNKIFERHDGAVVFRGSHTRVFVTKEGYPTYEAKDLALAKYKVEDFAYDKSIIITANEQVEYFKVVLEAMRRVLPDLAKKTIHESFGFVNLKEGKMSSRTGSIVTGEWVLDETKKRLKTQFPQIDAETLEKVAVGAVKYSMLKFSRKSDIAFSFEESIDLSGNSGPYLQYSFARTQSVLAKVQSSEFRVQSSESTSLEREEKLVLRLLIHFPEIIREAQENFAPNIICSYLFEFAQAFNLFYQKHKIRGSKNESFRLLLTQAAGQILKTGLYLLGIEAPERM